MTQTKEEKPLAGRVAKGVAVTVICTIVGGLIAGPAGAAAGIKIGCGGASCC